MFQLIHYLRFPFFIFLGFAIWRLLLSSSGLYLTDVGGYSYTCTHKTWKTLSSCRRFSKKPENRTYRIYNATNIIDIEND